MAKDISPAEIAANQKCDLFALIFQQIKHNPLLLNENLEMVLEDNPVSNKPEATIVKAGSFRASIRTYVAKHPVSGEIINNLPIMISSWREDSFHLKEGCETPPIEKLNNKAFENVEDSVKFFLSQIELISRENKQEV
ncbi:MAG TPA: hypothetical protein EYQ72_00045 [Gammaproteobacteria bacterium]|nr:hypothetical protein [Gammaproteobacteria bacterium]